MCMTTYVDGNFISTVGELVGALGRDAVVFNNPVDGPELPKPGDDECLCPVDFQKTAARAGMTFHTDHVGSFLMRPGQRYEWQCDCGERFAVEDKAAHWERHRGTGMSYSGPYLVGPVEGGTRRE